MSPSMTHEIQATNRIFEQEVAAQRNVQALDRVYTTKARVLPPGAAMVEGRENIKAFWRGAIEALDVSSVKLETLDFQVLGDGGVEIGQATLMFRAAGADEICSRLETRGRRLELGRRYLESKFLSPATNLVRP